MTLDDDLVPRGGLTVHLLDRECVVFVPESGDLHHLDGSATLVWQLLAPGVTLRSAAAEIAAATGAPVSAVERDVLALVRRLARLNLLVESPIRPSSGQRSI